MLDKRLAELIARLGMKSGVFAERIGFSQAYISLILNGRKTNPSQRFYDAAAREFGVDAEWLRAGEGEMFATSEPGISQKDAELIAKYRLLPRAERALVDEIVDAFLVRSNARNDSAATGQV